jgi:hypothetical protein
MPLIRQPTMRATFSFNFDFYLKIKFDTHPFVDNQMTELENKATQSLNEGSGNARSLDSYESHSPPQPPCAKRQRRPRLRSGTTSI